MTGQSLCGEARLAIISIEVPTKYYTNKGHSSDDRDINDQIVDGFKSSCKVKCISSSRHKAQKVTATQNTTAVCRPGKESSSSIFLISSDFQNVTSCNEG